jgi:hypothetical protein
MLLLENEFDQTEKTRGEAAMHAETMIDHLGADGPDPAISDDLQLFGQFVGAWDLEWYGTDHRGNAIRVKGELYFGWILEGRAVQDIWRVPLDSEDARRMRGFHGTTIRFYDRQLGAWHSTWIDPLNGRVRRFIGRPLGNSIVLEGMDEEPRERWSFRDITPDRFTWRGEESTDGGRTWVLIDEMAATRRTTR